MLSQGHSIDLKISLNRVQLGNYGHRFNLHARTSLRFKSSTMRIGRAINRVRHYLPKSHEAGQRRPPCAYYIHPAAATALHRLTGAVFGRVTSVSYVRASGWPPCALLRRRRPRLSTARRATASESRGIMKRRTCWWHAALTCTPAAYWHGRWRM